MLISYLGGSSSDKIREYGGKHWFPPNKNATDEFGFAALPGGYRPDDGEYLNVRHNAYFWSSTFWIPSNANYPEGWFVKLSSDLDPTLMLPTLEQDHTSYITGMSIRCIKD
jgi:uncharacterized protein (TIGR02145 family)